MASIAFFTAKVPGLDAWDVHGIEKGIAGSEEAVIYLSQELASRGRQVIVFGNPPKRSQHSLPEANPRFLPLQGTIEQKFDIGISCRMPKVGKVLRNVAKMVYLWPQDILGSELSLDEINAFDDVLWLSEWQRLQWMSVNPEFARFTTIFGNGINPKQFGPIQERENPYSCIYASNYSRGLELLLDIWPQIKDQQPKATLDVYYGWNHWGTMTAVTELKIKKQLNDLVSLGVKHHGLVGHKELHEAYARNSLWTYPCTSVETFCISALKAQYAGCMPVIVRHSALSETVQNGFSCSNHHDYASLLSLSMGFLSQMSVDTRKQMRDFIDQKYTWQVLANKLVVK